MEGAECCSHLGAYVDDIAWAGGNTITLTHFTCDVTARIQVQWYEQPPEWVGTSDLLQRMFPRVAIGIHGDKPAWITASCDG